MAAGSGTGSPCGACKFLRRKCSPDCVFAPYFCSDQGPARFAAIHKVFGASNISKLLLHLPVNDRCEAVVTIAYEAQARIRDPVYGCVAHIFALQQQVAYLQAQVMQVKAQLAGNHQWHILGNNNDSNNLGAIQLLGNEQGSFLNPMEQGCNGNNVGVKLERSSQVYPRDDEFFLQHFQPCGRKRGHEDEMSDDLQELALRIMSD